MRIPLKGSTSLFLAVVLVGIAFVLSPLYRLFFLISVGIGLVIAAGLALWHKYAPVKEEDVENKRPLGL